MLLPHDGPASSVLMSSAYQLDNNDYFDNEYKTSPLGNNRIQSNLDSQFTIDAERQRKTNTQNMNYKYTLNNNIDNTNY
jgi:hypothetical protein